MSGLGVRGAERPTLREVARVAGVSTMTASRALNLHRGVRPETRELIEQAARALNYVPNRDARALASKQPSHKIAFLFDVPNAVVLGEMVGAGFDEAADANMKLVCIRVRASDDPAATLLALQNLGIRGVVLSPPLCDDARLRIVLMQAGIRIVAIGCSDPDPGLSTIGIDDAGAVHDLTRYLLDLGHRRIGMIAGHPRHSSSVRRRAGYEIALRDFGIKPDPALQWEGDYTFGSALAIAEQALTMPTPPTAIFASNDDMAAAVVSVARGRGIAVPRSLTVCGFDDSQIALAVSPPLTTVCQPMGEMVAWGVNQLGAELAVRARGKVPAVRKVVLEHSIAYRGTDAPPEHGEQSVTLRKVGM